METIILPLLLMAGSSTVDSSSGSYGVRAQAIAQARIISGESVSFLRGNTLSFADKPLDRDQTFVLPTAHSRMVVEDTRQQQILEFH